MINKACSKHDIKIMAVGAEVALAMEATDILTKNHLINAAVLAIPYLQLAERRAKTCAKMLLYSLQNR